MRKTFDRWRHLKIKRSIAVRAGLYDLQLRNKVSVGNRFLRFAGLAHVGEVVLSLCQRRMPQFESKRRQWYPSDVAPACASLTQFVKFGVKFCPGFFGDILQLAKQVFVKFPIAIEKQSLVTAAFAPFRMASARRWLISTVRVLFCLP